MSAYQWTLAHYWRQLKNSAKLHLCVKPKLTCLRGTRKAIFSASLLAECNLAFPPNNMSSGVSALYIERIVLNGLLLLTALSFHPFISHVVKSIF